MSGIEARSRRLLEPLRRIGQGDPEPAAILSVREARVVAAMLERTEPRLPPLRAPIALAAVLALAAGAVLLLRVRAPAGHRQLDTVAPVGAVRGVHVTALRGAVTRIGADGSSGPARSGQALAEHDQLQVRADASAVLELGSGAAARVGAQTEIVLGRGVTANAERISLARGALSLEVPPLGTGRSLSVETPHGTVTVVGTRFSVAVVPVTAAAAAPVAVPGGPGPLRSCVFVAQGSVRVDAGGATYRLGPGQHWSSDGGPCAAPDETGSLSTAERESLAAASPSGTPGSVASTTAAREQRRPARVGSPPRPSSGTTGEPAGSAPPMAAFGVSTLDRQIALFTAAMEARRAGDDARALALLDQLVLDFPDSSLAGQARQARDAIRRKAPPE